VLRNTANWKPNGLPDYRQNKSAAPNPPKRVGDLGVLIRKNNMNDNDNLSGIYNDDGTKINPALISKPSLCVTCKKDDLREEEILCLLTRNDQAGEKEFKCYAYESKYNK